MRREENYNGEALPSSSVEVGAPDGGSVQNKVPESVPSEGGDEAEGILRGFTEPPDHSVGGSTQNHQQQQQRKANAPVLLSPQEVDNISELCLQVILEHETEKACRPSSTLLQTVIHAGSAPLGAPRCQVNNQLSGGSREVSEEGAGSNVNPSSDKPGSFAPYEAFTPACTQQLQATSAAGRGEASQDPSVPEQDLDLYATRTISVLLLAGQSPVRIEDLRRSWMALPMQLRKRNFTWQVLGRAAAIATSCFGLQLLSFQVKGTKYAVFTQGLRFVPHLQLIRSRREEELRGFLLFLSLQFLSYQAELPLEAVKASIRLVGREDLLLGFDESSLLKAVHFREPSHKLESLGDLLSECESLKYIIIKRRPSVAGEGAEDALYIMPTERLLKELQVESFRNECKATFGVELPETRLLTPEGGEVEGVAADNALTQG
ncbi:hypothetical protein, conserved [Eimeria brunetti]|uniref:Uncharacterized protein n=1 Tax=Eimeria brunetti TaxID=51314 RepID=U6LFR4_9EIME|nr:hypothetical protein, conserved [Eimeria brunetti]